MYPFTNLRELIRYFNNEQICREYLEQKRWNGTPTCPHCACRKVYKLTKTKAYRCSNKDCKKTFNALTRTIFENSNIPLSSWYIAIYLHTAHKKGISSYQLSKDIGVTQKTAWFILQRIRYAMKEKGFLPSMGGIVEVDETFVGGKNKNRHWDKKVKNSQGRSFKDKTPVLGILQRNSNIRCIVIPDTKAETIQPIVADSVEMGSTLMTDEWKAYKGLDVIYNHQIVDHGRGQYVNGECYTNGIENFWSILKRGIIGIYHKTTRKHLQLYCDEFTYRYNNRKLTDSERFHLSISQVEGRLKYKDLIAA